MTPLTIALPIAMGCCIVTLADDAASLSSATTDDKGFLSTSSTGPFKPARHNSWCARR